jgi:hypothetical protein
MNERMECLALRAVSDRSHRNLFNIIFLARLEKQPIFNINSPACRQSIGLDNKTPNTGCCARRKHFSRNNGREAGGKSGLG